MGKENSRQRGHEISGTEWCTAEKPRECRKSVDSSTIRFRVRREQLQRFERLLPENGSSQGPNLAVSAYDGVNRWIAVAARHRLLLLRADDLTQLCSIQVGHLIHYIKPQMDCQFVLDTQMVNSCVLEILV